MPARMDLSRSTIALLAAGSFPALILVSSLATSTVAQAAPTPSTIHLVSTTPVTEPLAPEWSATPVTFAPKPAPVVPQVVSSSRVVSSQSPECVAHAGQLATITVKLRAGSADVEQDTTDLQDIVDHLIDDCGWRVSTVNAAMVAAR